MRAFVVLGGLIILHSAVVFISSDGWFVNDAHPNVGFAIFATWALTWGMPLLMLVSGMGACYGLRRRSAGEFARERLTRLGIPLLVGLFLLVPPMWYVQQLRRPEFHESYWRFWLRFVDVLAMAKGTALRAEWPSRGIVVDPAHTWFLYTLLAWSMLLLPVFVYLRTPRGARLVDRLARFAEQHGLAALAMFAIPIVFAEALFGATDNTGGWDRVPYLFFLLIGFLIALDGRFEAALRRGRKLALMVAVPTCMVLIVWAGRIDESGGDLLNGTQTGWSALQALTGWFWVVAIFGFASSIGSRRSRRFLERVSTRSRWSGIQQHANEAVLPFYLLHLPIIVGVAWFVVRWDAFILVKYFSLVAISFVGTVALFELVRRFRVTRFLFGMKMA